MKKTQAKAPSRRPIAHKATAPAGTDALLDISGAVGSIAQAIAGIDVEDVAKYKLDEIGEHIGGVAQAIYALSAAADRMIIAQHGSDEDRARLVAHLKQNERDIFRD